MNYTQFKNSLKFNAERFSTSVEFPDTLKDCLDKLVAELGSSYSSPEQIAKLIESDKFKTAITNSNQSSTRYASKVFEEKPSQNNITIIAGSQVSVSKLCSDALLKSFKFSPEYVFAVLELENMEAFDNTLIQFFNSIWSLSFLERYNELIAINLFRLNLESQFKN
jgi:hypothetical protein